MSTQFSLTILNNFTCLGSDCPDDCCHGWNLHIDTKTLLKWKSLDNESLRVELLDSVSVINENDCATEVVQQQSDGCCVLLSEQGLCTIQQRCGHEFLPEICREYPRVSIATDEIQLQSAHLSCPGIIQLLLKQESAADLFTILSVSNDTQLSSETNDLGLLFSNTTTQVLSETHFSLGLRLYFIARLLEQLAIISTQVNNEKKQVKICRFTSKSLSKQLSNIQIQHERDKLKINKKLSGVYWQFVFHFCRALNDCELKARLELSTSYQKLVKLNQSNILPTEKDYLKYYQVLHKLQTAIPKKLNDEIDAILASVMMVKFKNHGFPWYPYENSLELTYLDCVIPYSQINLILYLLYDSEQKITEKDIITAIYKVEKTVAHNTLILEQLKYQPELLQLTAYAGCWLT
jgi:lysine-N-methylase